MFRYTYIDKQGKLLCDVSEYVQKHNIVYKTPVRRVADGMPVGNGAMGGLVYHTDRELCMRINHTDCYDHTAPFNFGAWAMEWEEKCTALVNCGVVKISDGTPAYAWEYLDDYNMTLDMGKAVVQMDSKTPWAENHIKGYGSLEDPCFIWEVEASSEEPLERTITLDRYGTRAFFHYYECFTRDTKRRLYNISAQVTDNAMMVTQKLDGCTFTTAVHVECEGAVYKVNNKREVQCVIPAATSAAYKIYITTALTENEEDTEAMAEDQLAVACKTDVYAKHLAWWKEYWNRSFINIENDYLENVYYINRYQFGCSGYGKYPPSVFGSLWNTLGDTHNWGHYMHWNDQQQFWPCDTWNAPELSQPYFNYRRKMLPNAIADCKELHGIEGAWYSDISNIDGYQAAEPDTRRNMSCGAMLCAQMYHHYKHYLNQEFLLNTAYPIMKACGDMYMNLFVKEEDGHYHIHDVTPMEGYLYMKDTLSDWGAARSLFMALLDIADIVKASQELKDAWQDALDNMYEPATYEVDGKTILAFGRMPDGTVRTTGGYPEGGMGLSTVGNLICVFPASIYGKYTKDPYAQIVRNTVEHYHGNPPRMGWDTINEVAARYGYGEQIRSNMEMIIGKYQVFRNGMTHFDPPPFSGTFKARAIEKDVAHTPWGDMHEKDKGERVIYDADRFFHFYSEPEGCICTTLNESLLQSWEGIIRVFPASVDANSMFRLHAEGDFMVTSQKIDGRVRFVSIESRQGGTVKIASPFAELECVRLDMKEHPYTLDEWDGQRILTFATEAGKSYVVFSRSEHIDGSYPTYVPVTVNTEPKKCGERMIGMERDF